jgi:transposase-like protein
MKPLNRHGDLLTGKPCTKCKTPFAIYGWPRSKWTESGWSPWCPTCHKDFAPSKEIPARRGPKPKMKMQAWTNLPE